MDYLTQMNLTKKKKIKSNGRISYDPTILCDLHDLTYDPTIFCDPATILNFFVRWDHKIVRFYDPDRDFDNHDFKILH